ncbi:3-deoxy-manno-octulosonate cytidylyltransferase [Commensalibacter sp. Nvir]|uniref:3-deoxy-manno-octulosonate cytidylyltransferase n=1 Tax=Commensalibacter sp. Nvir TaxID=3069817 RepID=UPI002D6124F9|nr:3-deoxy-manno-octulosonate cytidylyltransferase [Commensalibacter sp. Nvir]
MNTLIIIPTRLASTRLPGKALANIAGKPMIIRVYEQALRANIGDVIVASGDKEISEVVRKFGGYSIDTDPKLASGSDRVYQALTQIKNIENYQTIINLQGDLPLINPEDISQVLVPLMDDSIDMATLISPIRTEFEKTAPSVVKVACSFIKDKPYARAMYFSRSLIPWGEGMYWHHIGVYAYRLKTLKTFVQLPVSPLEQRENLEQLRALEAGMVIGCACIKKPPFGVDTAEDLQRVREALKNE